MIKGRSPHIDSPWAPYLTRSVCSSNDVTTGWAMQVAVIVTQAHQKWYLTLWMLVLFTAIFTTGHVKNSYLSGLVHRYRVYVPEQIKQTWTTEVNKSFESSRRLIIWPIQSKIQQNLLHYLGYNFCISWVYGCEVAVKLCFNLTPFTVFTQFPRSLQYTSYWV